MANNYTQFSFAVKTTTEQSKWLSDVHEICTDADGTADDKPPTDPRFTAAYTLIEQCIAGDLSPNCVSLETDEDGAWFYSDESGDVEYTVDLIQAFLLTFNLDSFVSFTWANTCSKPRLDEFDGGAIVIAKDETRYLSPSRWIDEQITAIKTARETV